MFLNISVRRVGAQMCFVCLCAECRRTYSVQVSACYVAANIPAHALVLIRVYVFVCVRHSAGDDGEFML